MTAETAQAAVSIPWGWILSGAGFIGGLLLYIAKLFFERSLDQRDRRMEREEAEKERKQRKAEEDRMTETRMIMRGLKTLTECQYEVVYQMQTGHHNGGLEDCLNNITAYRRDVDQWFEDLAVRR